MYSKNQIKIAAYEVARAAADIADKEHKSALIQLACAKLAMEAAIQAYAQAVANEAIKAAANKAAHEAYIEAACDAYPDPE